MKRTYLEVTFRKGKPLVAYLCLPRHANDRSARVETVGDDFAIDYAEDGRPIGIEILSPRIATVEQINAILTRIHLPPVEAVELAPLTAV